MSQLLQHDTNTPTFQGGITAFKMADEDMGTVTFTLGDSHALIHHSKQNSASPLGHC